jgi:uncharacterized protein with von Willebrand factor type A (vWA) domain
VTDQDEPRREGSAPKDGALSAGVGKGASRVPSEAGAGGSLDARVSSLAAALRRARIDNAEHSGALADLRGAEIARLEILRDALEPVLVQIPADCDIFDVAVSPGERPRLFIDQIGFIEMARDRRTYRFLQDTRHGRITIGESDDIEHVVEAITTYIAHRLIEREKALAVDYASGGAAAARAAQAATARPAPARRGFAMDEWSNKLFNAFLFLCEFLGSTVFFGLLALLGLWVYRTYVAR